MTRDEFARNLAAGTYGLIVLDILREGPNYGYGIRKRIFQQSKGTLNWQDGTIYPVLRQLETQGLVTGQWRGPKDGRQRCYYSLTPRGQRACQHQRRQWTAFTRCVNALLEVSIPITKTREIELASRPQESVGTQLRNHRRTIRVNVILPMYLSRIPYRTLRSLLTFHLK